MSRNAVNSDTFLEGQNNWELWIYIVKRIAEVGDVWKHINPDQAHHPLQKPWKPLLPVPTIQHIFLRIMVTIVTFGSIYV